MESLARRASQEEVETEVESNEKCQILVIQARGIFLADQVISVLKSLMSDDGVKAEKWPWKILNLKPSVGSMFLPLCKDKVRPFSFSNRTILVTPNAVITDSKRGN